MKKALALILVLAMAMVFPAVSLNPDNSSEVPADATYKDTITINSGAINFADPFQTDNATHAKLYLSTHSRLLEKDIADNWKIVPGLAESYEWTSDSIIQFKLRDGVKFHNGETLTSDDVVFTFENILSLGNNAVKLNMIKNVEAVDSLTVSFTLESHNVDFLSLVSETFCSICNRKACEADAVDGPRIGTGPYYVTEFEPGDHVYTEKFKDYFGESPKTEHLYFVNIPEASTALIALQNGEIDISEIAPEDLDFVKEDNNIDYRQDLSNGDYYLAFNTSKGITADENLRLAIAYAVDIEDIVMFLGEGNEPASVHWGTSMYGYDNSIQPYERNLELAKEYLAKAFPDGNAKLTITCGNSLNAGIAQIIQANCKEIGLDIQVDTVEAAALTAMSKFSVAEHQAMIATIGWNSYGDDSRRAYYPNSNVNKSVLTDEEIMSLLDKASVEPDDATRQELYHKVQQICHEKCYYLPLAIGTNCYAFTKGLSGVQLAPNGRDNYSYAYIIES